MDDGILIPCFFHDPETFQVLRNDILPGLLDQAEHSGKTLRLWSIGSSVTEDAYSLAMLLANILGDALPTWDIRIFATASNETTLNFAKAGLYHQNSLQNIPDDERTRWFEHTDQHYHISSVLRKMVIIGRHDITQDTPFAHLDLILCREALLPCPTERQQELVRLFAFSLAPRHGYLVLGRSESITLSTLSFQQVIATIPIYQSISNPTTGKTGQGSNTASLIKQLLHYKGLTPSGGLTTPPPLSLQEVLFRLSPTGIVVIDHTYRIITANRAAHRLCSLSEKAHLQDFLHSVPGLPYASTRSAIDTTFYEGDTQNIPEVELALTHGGNGRVLSIIFCLLPGEVITPDYVVIYIQEVTEQTIAKQAHQAMYETLQTIQANQTALSEKYTLLVKAHEQLQHTSAEILSLYEQLLVDFEECQMAKETMEQDQAAIMEELETVCTALSLYQTT